MKKALIHTILLIGFCSSVLFSPGYSQTHFNCVSNTGSSYSIVIQQATIDGQPIQPGDEIVVLTSSALCVGAVAPDSSIQIALAAWKDDPQTSQVDGYTPGDTMHFRIFDASGNLEMGAVAIFSTGDGTFESGIFSIITTLNGVSNPAPVITLPDTVTFPEDGSIFLNLNTFAADPNDPDSLLSWTVSGLMNVNADIDVNTRIAKISAKTDWFGEEKIFFTVSDTAGAVGADSTIVVVTPVNDPPSTPQLLAPGTGEKSSALKWRQSVDPDSGDTLHYLVQIATDSFFSQNIDSSTTSSEELAITEFSSRLDSGRVYFWRVQAMDQQNARSGFSEVGSFRYQGGGIVTDIADGDTPELPSRFVLHQNYPNPFNPSTVVGFQLPVSSEVMLTIYNLNGQVVRQLVNGKYAVGNHSVVWDTTDNNGLRVASGVYVYRLQAGEFVQTRKLVLAR